MAKNLVFNFTNEKVRERQVPSGTVAGTPLLINTRPAVALTSRGDVQIAQTFGNLTITEAANAKGSGNLANSASVAFDGTFEFTGITGVTTSTGQDVAVYITSGGALTTTATSNTLFGYTDYPRDYNKATGRAPVRIGA